MSVMRGMLVCRVGLLWLKPLLLLRLLRLAKGVAAVLQIRLLLLLQYLLLVLLHEPLGLHLWRAATVVQTLALHLRRRLRRRLGRRRGHHGHLLEVALGVNAHDSLRGGVRRSRGVSWTIVVSTATARASARQHRRLVWGDLRRTR